jgi:hypothetical protein
MHGLFWHSESPSQVPTSPPPLPPPTHIEKSPRTKVEAEELEGVEDGVVEDLRLEEHVPLGDVPVVVAVRRHHLCAVQ